MNVNHNQRCHILKHWQDLQQKQKTRVPTVSFLEIRNSTRQQQMNIKYLLVFFSNTISNDWIDEGCMLESDRAGLDKSSLLHREYTRYNPLHNMSNCCYKTNQQTKCEQFFHLSREAQKQTSFQDKLDTAGQHFCPTCAKNTISSMRILLNTNPVATSNHLSLSLSVCWYKK